MSVRRSLRCRIVRPSNCEGSRAERISLCVGPAAPVRARQAQDGLDEEVGRLHVLQMEERQALAERLHLVVSLNPKPLARVNGSHSVDKRTLDFVGG